LVSDGGRQQKRKGQGTNGLDQGKHAHRKARDLFKIRVIESAANSILIYNSRYHKVTQLCEVENLNQSFRAEFLFSPFLVRYTLKLGTLTGLRVLNENSGLNKL